MKRFSVIILAVVLVLSAINSPCVAKEAIKFSVQLEVWIQRTPYDQPEKVFVASINKPFKAMPKCHRWWVLPTSIGALEKHCGEFVRLMMTGYAGKPFSSLRIPFRIEDKHLAVISKLKGLRKLSLWDGNKITNAGIKHVSKLKGLQQLYLYDCDKINDYALIHISKLRKLQELDLGNCNKITDIGLAHISQLKNLQKLDLANCHKITNTGLLDIAKLKILQDLVLFNCCKITDTGL